MPTFMDKLELKRRVREGLENRRRRGELITFDNVAKADRRGASFTKDQRKRFVSLTELAIASLARHEFDDWFDAIRMLARLMRQARFDRRVYIHTVKEIEHTAVSINGERDLYDRAQKYLKKRRGIIISIPGQSPKHAKREADTDDPVHSTASELPPRQGPERGTTD